MIRKYRDSSPFNTMANEVDTNELDRVAGCQLASFPLFSVGVKQTAFVIPFPVILNTRELHGFI